MPGLLALFAALPVAGSRLGGARARFVVRSGGTRLPLSVTFAVVSRDRDADALERVGDRLRRSHAGGSEPAGDEHQRGCEGGGDASDRAPGHRLDRRRALGRDPRLGEDRARWRSATSAPEGRTRVARASRAKLSSESDPRPAISPR